MKAFFKLGIALALVTSSHAFANGVIRADLGYVSETEKSGSSDTSSTRQIIDVGGGYLWSSGLALIGQYAMETDTDSNSGTTTTKNRTSYGPGLGWISPSPLGMYITGVYYISSKLNSGSTTYTGTGLQVDLGVKIPVSQVAIIIGMSYASFDYTKTNLGPLTPALKVTHIDPRVGLMFEF